LLNLDEGADRPDLARVELHRVVQVVNEMIAKGIIYADGEQSGTGTQRFGLLKVGSESSAPWHSATRAVDVGSLSAIFQTSGGVAGVARNMYTDDDGVTWRYRATGVAQLILMGAAGEVATYTAPSAGGAGTVASVFERQKISATGVVTFNSNIARHDGNTVHGRIFGNGTKARLPTGWTSLRASLGLYTITHNLNTRTYTVIPGTEENLAVARAQIFNKGLNDFQIGTTSGTVAASTDMISTFIMMRD